MTIPRSIAVLIATLCSSASAMQELPGISRVPADQDAVTPGENDQELGKLLRLLRKLDETTKQIAWTGEVRVLEKTDTKRRDGETDEQFILRQIVRKPRFAGLAFPVAASRDLQSGNIHTRFGTLAAGIGYLEFFHDAAEQTTTKLMGVEPGRAQATITKGRVRDLGRSTEMLPRMDLLAFRPILDYPLRLIVTNTALKKGKGLVADRPKFNVRRLKASKHSGAGWVVTFQHLEPAGEKRHEILWYRIFFEQRGEVVLVRRVDELRVTTELPKGVVDAGTVRLLEDYRRVNGVHVPHRVRNIVLGLNFTLGTVLEVKTVSVNEPARVMKELPIPVGTSVRDEVKNLRYRVRE